MCVEMVSGRSTHISRKVLMASYLTRQSPAESWLIMVLMTSMVASSVRAGRRRAGGVLLFNPSTLLDTRSSAEGISVGLIEPKMHAMNCRHLFACELKAPDTFKLTAIGEETEAVCRQASKTDKLDRLSTSSLELQWTEATLLKNLFFL